ncbi:unnamed protein product [Notodromas monacha]|uniref:Cytochrome c oxidase subunit 6B1 n=1 Tax=Notodromas monacha TaxID=399045 RepID=A0A7R9GFE3_9CRUS|nr:unnamed protein product [Notodromas monacha]CAG0918745.1 unnamed protein product [Notodromas monacha]
MTEEITLETAPFDPRFPNQNQTRQVELTRSQQHCYVSYVDYHRCIKIKGEDFEPCNYFKKVFTSLCPNAWVEQWNTQREENRFAGPL